MLYNGIAINKVDGLRPLLERANSSLAESSNLKVFIPKIEARERGDRSMMQGFVAEGPAL